MKYADRVRVTSTSTSASSVALGSALAGCRTLAQAINEDGAAGLPNAIKIGDQNISFVVTDASGNWEAGRYTITSATQIDRTQRVSTSNGGNAVTFDGGSLTVSNDVLGEDLARVAVDRDVPFSQTVPLDQVGVSWMAPITTSGTALAFNPGSNSVKGAYATVRVTGDGATDVTAPGFKSLSGSGTYDKTAGTVNIFEFEYDGYDFIYAVVQRGVAASGADGSPPNMVGSLSSSNITSNGYTLTWSAATDNVGVTAYEVSTNGGATYVNVGNVLTWSASGMTASTTYQNSVRAVDAAGNKATPISLAVTTTSSSDGVPPSMNGAITVSAITQTGYTLSWPAGSDNVGVAGYEYSTNGGSSYTNVGNVLTTNVTGATAGSTYNVAVRDYDAAGNRGTAITATVTTSAATAPGAPTNVSATPGDSSATVTWTQAASNGGSALTSQTINAYNASTNALVSSTNIAAGATSGTVSTLTNGTGYYFKVYETNGAGNGPESAQSSTIVPAAVVWPKIDTSTAVHVSQTGTGPYDVVGDGTALSSSNEGAFLIQSLAASTDGYLEFKVVTAAQIIIGFKTANIMGGYTGIYYGLFVNGTTDYRSMASGVNATLTSYPIQAGDILRVARAGNILKLQIARAATPTTFTDMATKDYGSAPLMYMQLCVYGTGDVRLSAMGGFA